VARVKGRSKADLRPGPPISRKSPAPWLWTAVIRPSGVPPVSKT